MFQLRKQEDVSRGLTSGRRSGESRAGSERRYYEIIYTRVLSESRLISLSVGQSRCSESRQRITDGRPGDRQPLAEPGWELIKETNMESQPGLRKGQYSSSPPVCVCVLRLPVFVSLPPVCSHLRPFRVIKMRDFLKEKCYCHSFLHLVIQTSADEQACWCLNFYKNHTLLLA